MVQNEWEDSKASLESDLEDLVYRSNLFGQDRSVVNLFGGNTSTKSTEKDFRGKDVEVMWVKGSGSDLATMTGENFTGLKMEDIRPLMDRDNMSDEDMVDYLAHSMIDSAHPRSSIETLLHAFLPYKHVDHTHPDAIISIACADNGQGIAKEIYGDRFVWVPYIRPGFKLSKMIAEGVQNNPKADLVIMEKHGLVTWGDSSKESYDKTIAIIQEAEDYIQGKAEAQSPFGGQKHDALEETERKETLAQVLPFIRGQVSKENKMIITYDDSEPILRSEERRVGKEC